VFLARLAAPAHAAALCCDQPGSATASAAEMNANLICRRGAQTCVVPAQSIAGPPACPLAGCALDFGTRTVTFSGPITLSSGKLVVTAAGVAVGDANTVGDAIVAAGPDTVVDLTATGTTCADGDGDLRVEAPIDLSATSAGTIRLAAACELVVDGGGSLTANSSATSGGAIDLRAGTSLSQLATLRALGSGGDGGTINLTAGDDLAAQGPIDVHSLGDGEGGDIALHAGDAVLGGVEPGGALTLSSDLIADGSTDSDGQSGEDGGSVDLQAAGAILVTSTATIHASGASPDGSGGNVSFTTVTPPLGVIGPLDGDVTVAGPITLRGAGGGGDGGELDGSIGRGFSLQSPVDVSAGTDAVGGTIELSAGGDVSATAAIAANGRSSGADGGSIDLKAGLGISTATLTLAKNIDVSGGTGDGAGGDARLASERAAERPRRRPQRHRRPDAVHHPGGKQRPHARRWQPLSDDRERPHHARRDPGHDGDDRRQRDLQPGAHHDRAAPRSRSAAAVPGVRRRHPPAR